MKFFHCPRLLPFSDTWGTDTPENTSWQQVQFALNTHLWCQGCGSGSGSEMDPDSFGSVDSDPDPYSESGSGSKKCWMFSFESWRLLLFCNLDVLCGGLGIGIFFFSCKFVSIVGHQNPRIRIGSGSVFSLKGRIRIRIKWIRIRNPVWCCGILNNPVVGIINVNLTTVGVLVWGCLSLTASFMETYLSFLLLRASIAIGQSTSPSSSSGPPLP